MRTQPFFMVLYPIPMHLVCLQIVCIAQYIHIVTCFSMWWIILEKIFSDDAFVLFCCQSKQNMFGSNWNIYSLIASTWVSFYGFLWFLMAQYFFVFSDLNTCPSSEMPLPVLWLFVFVSAVWRVCPLILWLFLSYPSNALLFCVAL